MHPVMAQYISSLNGDRNILFPYQFRINTAIHKIHQSLNQLSQFQQVMVVIAIITITDFDLLKKSM